MRIYVPATLDELDSVRHTESAALWTLQPRAAHGVTAALRAERAEDLEEVLEDDAMQSAVVDAYELLAERPTAPRQRLVVSLDVPPDALEALEPQVAQDSPPEASSLRIVRELVDVPIVCVHVDEPAACQAIADLDSARRDYLRDDATQDDFMAACERLDAYELLWYDWSELEHIPRG